ncbi:MAG: hypothetical protein RIQ59_1068 [Bacteroidota bacterium]|jgi:outer membrane protein
MKKIVLTVAAVFVLSFANAQDKKESDEGFSKGDVFMSGSFNISNSKWASSGNYEESAFTFAPSLGYFVSENFALGLGLNLSNSSAKATSSSAESKTSTVGLALMGRYYFTPSSKFSSFVHGEFDYLTMTMDPGSLKANGYGFAIAPGFNYFVSKNLALETSIGMLSYASAKADVAGAQASTNFKLGLDFSKINFGLSYKF